MREQIATLLEELIRIPSVNAQVAEGSGEGDAARHLVAWLASRGVDARTQAVDDRTVNTVAQVRGERPRGRLLLCSHLDTVGVDGTMAQPWQPQRRDDAIWGRGACDAKGSVAVMARLMVAAASKPPRWDLTFAAVGDEEVGGSGIRHFLAADHAFDASVVGEPTQERMVIAHRGALRLVARLTGRSAHSSVPEEGSNALVGAAAVIEHLTRWSATAPWTVHPLAGRPTLTPTLLTAGVGANVVPGEAVLTWDRRTVPPEDPDEVYREILAEAARVPLPNGVQLRWDEPVTIAWLDTPAQHPLVQQVGRGLELTGLNAEPVGASYGTDGCRIASYGIPVVVLGPGSIRDAHGPRESVRLDSLERVYRALEHLLWE